MSDECVEDLYAICVSIHSRTQPIVPGSSASLVGLKSSPDTDGVVLPAVRLPHTEKEVLPVAQGRTSADRATLRARELAQTFGELSVTLAEFPGAGAAGTDRCKRNAEWG